MSNPFTTPDRVPPPATRVLSPGSAQPYYPGDVPPGTSMGPFPPTTYGPGPTSYPAIPGALPGGNAPGSYPPSIHAQSPFPNSTYAPANPPLGGAPMGGYAAPGPSTPNYAPPATGNPYAPGPGSAPTTPPGGWPNGYGRQSQAPISVEGDQIAIPSDSLDVRLAAVPPPSFGDWNSPGGSEAPDSMDGIFGRAERVVSASAVPLGTQPTRNTLPPQTPLASPTTGFARGATNSTASLWPAHFDAQVTPAQWSEPSVQPRDSVVPGVEYSARLRDARPDSFSPQGASQRQTQGDDVRFTRPPVSDARLGESRGDDLQRYGTDTNYHELRGRLEFLAGVGQWKIRYIPIDGRADVFGGSVLISNPQVLGNLQSGDYVVVQGKLIQGATDARSLSPAYQITSLQRQR